MAAAVVGGLEAVGMTSAMAATSKKYSAHKVMGAVYPKVGKPGPTTKNFEVRTDCTCDITWSCTPGQCGHPCKSPAWCYHWFDSCNGASGGPVCAWTNCATHVQCGIE